MHYVYILRSKKNKDKIYIGITNNLERRLEEHGHAANDSYTHRHAPWEIETYTAFKNQALAEEFEVYLKSHAGRVFLRRRLMASVKEPAKSNT